MSEVEDPRDEIKIISQKLKSATTIEPAYITPEQTKTLQMSRSAASSSIPETKTSNIIEDNSLVRNLPELNLPEKIVLVVDTVRERKFTPFKLGSGIKYTPLFMIKRVVETFLSAKSMIQRSHEFALVTLSSQGSQWNCDFTNNIKTIINQLDCIDEDVHEDDQKSYDLGQLFEKIQANVHLPTISQGALVPSFVTRVVLIYSRSNCMPKFHTGEKCVDKLTENPYFFLDVLYVHEPPNSENICEEIYSKLSALDTTNFSYILEVGRNPAKLHDNMAKILAHPLQRPLQKDASYSIYSSLALQEIDTNV